MRYKIQLVLIILLLTTITAFAEGLTVSFLDVGQADSAILTCDGETLMIDGGNAGDSDFIYSYLKNTLGLTHIDYMIATLPHEDHIGGLSAALNACTVGMLYSPVTEYDSKPFSSLLKYADRQGVEITVPNVGDRFNLGKAEVQILSPCRNYPDMNDMSIVVRVVYGDTAFLFTGDAAWDAEHDLLQSGYPLSADVLKVGHHGSDTSTCYAFLRAVMPRYAVISVGEGNAYGHPSGATLSRLRDAGSLILRTDIDGDIVFHSDGEDVWVEKRNGE